MWSLERHRDVGAYALGVLDPAERFRFEDHLPECATCASLVGELAPTTGALALYARVTPPCVEVLARPAPTFLDRAVDRLGALHRRTRRRLWGATVAALLVLAAAGQGVAMLTGVGTGSGHTATLRGHDAGTGVAATVTADDQDWGTQVGLDVRDSGGPRVCELVAVGRDGSEQTVATWTVRGDPVALDGGVAARPADLARFEVRAADGIPLLTLPMRAS
ncbi:zf-HC2 domain-containing protein [Streptomyces endophyticus]|uniref:Zf-HC2 domain-containing protein n=1 Tax=Streptomyces endophyticus TaxID=714166 RepID=A0ABU6F7V8_9ACTN|nr:zf-HC2 domain-containing protein [Streptomyces endophyticus]MEB8340118.1 zf-HC2 domain-containing protein [Streptomyces endophyticus]